MNNPLLHDEAGGRELMYAYNMCLVLATQIVDYNDTFIVQKVYEEILNNINFQIFPKENGLYKALQDLLRSLSEIKLTKEEEEFYTNEFKIMKKNAFWDAVPSPSIILSGEKPAGLALTALLQISTSLMHYKQSLNTTEAQERRKRFELAQHYRRVLESLTNNLYATKMELFKGHEILDEYALTEKDIKNYEMKLECSDPAHRYDLLLDISSQFKAYAPFWYNLGEAARQAYENKSEKDYLDYKEKAISAFQQFEEFHRDILRIDIFAASCALAHISLLDIRTDSVQMNELLNKAIRYAGKGTPSANYELLQQCVPVLIQLERYNEAVELLRTLNNNYVSPEINGPLLSLFLLRLDLINDYHKLEKRFSEKGIDLKKCLLPIYSIPMQYPYSTFDDMMKDGSYLIKIESEEKHD